MKCRENSNMNMKYNFTKHFSEKFRNWTNEKCSRSVGARGGHHSGVLWCQRDPTSGTWIARNSCKKTRQGYFSLKGYKPKNRMHRFSEIWCSMEMSNLRCQGTGCHSIKKYTEKKQYQYNTIREKTSANTDSRTRPSTVRTLKLSEGDRFANLFSWCASFAV